MAGNVHDKVMCDVMSFVFIFFLIVILYIPIMFSLQ